MATYRYRFPPCPVYDMEGIESWLEEQSLRGLSLVKYNAWGLFVFERTVPTPARYRLEAAQKRHAFWDENMNPPVPMQELAQECGWFFVTYCAGFYIFRSSDPHGPELNTDPSIQAISLKYLKKRWRSSLIVMLVYLAILLFGLGPGFFYHMVTEGSLLMILLFLFIAMEICNHLGALIHIARIHRRLSSGRNLTPRPVSDRSAKMYRFRQYTFYGLILVMLLSIGHHHMVNLGLGEHPLAQYPGMPPFVTLEELAPADTEITYGKIDNGHYQSRPDALIPVNLYWLDGGEIRYPDGATTAGLLEIEYCETVFPWLARAIGTDYQDHYEMLGKTQPIRLPELDVDYAAAFVDAHGLPRVVLAEGNTVVCTRFSQADVHGCFTIEAWAQAMARRLNAEGGS